jgi:protein-L-isoaspartate(D-aspartate) O-methyltransferase
VSTPATLRDGLVRELRSRGVIRTDAVAAAFAAVPREHFIPEVVAEQGLEAAYQDRAFPTKHDRRGMPVSSSSQPAMMAEMLELLELAPGQRVLEVGAGTGYNAAVVSQIVGPKGRVTTIDIDPEIAQRAKAALRKNGSRADVWHGDGRAGFAQGQPYDRIIVTASAEVVQPAWLEQLEEGGRIIVPLRLDPDADSIQLIPVFERRGRELRSLELTSGGFMPLHGGDGGWSAHQASLNAGRHQPGRHSAFASISGAPVGRLSDAAAQRVLAAMLAAPSASRQGWSPVSRGHTPLIVTYLLITIPFARRVWVRHGKWHGIGIVDLGGGGLAVVSIPSVWDTNPDPAATRARWRLESYGEYDKPRAELEELLARWRALDRHRPHGPEITARLTGEAVRLRLRWRPVPG